MAERIRVLVRVRPLLARELLEGDCVYCKKEEGSLNENYRTVEVRSDKTVTSTFNAVLDRDTAQEDVYSYVTSSVSKVTDGINATIIAYGQTGTGKTHTMFGDAPPGKRGEVGAGGGIIPRAVKQIFDDTSKTGRETKVHCSYLEVYNEKLHDLLAPFRQDGSHGGDPRDMRTKGMKAGLEIREAPDKEVYIPDLSRIKVNSMRGVAALLRKGAQHREIRHTTLNEQSSRSHTILQLFVEQHDSNGEGGGGTVMRSKLNLVDLAGSERWDTNIDMENSHTTELTSINTSLSALTNVIGALTQSRVSHVPYRDSKLTYLLQDSLGGNCHTTIIATLSPSISCAEESCSTLKFADRARNIVTNAVRNVQQDDSLVLERQNKEIERLRRIVLSLTGADGEVEGGTQIALQDRLLELEDENKRLKHQVTELKSSLKQATSMRHLGHLPNTISPTKLASGGGIPQGMTAYNNYLSPKSKQRAGQQQTHEFVLKPAMQRRGPKSKSVKSTTSPSAIESNGSPDPAVRETSKTIGGWGRSSLLLDRTVDAAPIPIDDNSRLYYGMNYDHEYEQVQKQFNGLSVVNGEMKPPAASHGGWGRSAVMNKGVVSSMDPTLDYSNGGDVGSLIYVLGSSSSSVKAQKMASLRQRLGEA